MGIDAGSQVILCDLPVRFDTYGGCTHNCSYCFVKKWKDISQVNVTYGEKALMRFILGKRDRRVSWCDWNIPLHWGGVSDPFQPAELIHGASKAALKVFAGTQYPVVISTKGVKVATRPDYLELLGQCNLLMQVSMMGPTYDKYEDGAPTFMERVAALPALAAHSKRLVLRLQPYVPGMREEVGSFFQAYADAGVHGVTLEGMKARTPQQNFVRLAGDFVPDLSILKPDVMRLRDLAHKAGLRFYCSENRLRSMGDSANCCGFDGLEGFVGNHANMCHLGEGEKIEYTPRMKEKGTADCFTTLCQTTAAHRAMHEWSYEEAMDIARRSAKFRQVMGLPNGPEK
jgi:DNA repair photolyase